MATFLSPEWVDSLAAGARSSDDVADATAEVTLTIQHVVTGAPAPAGEVRYWVRIHRGSVDAGPGQAAAPDVTFTEDYATAAGLSRGDLTPQAAFLAGRVKVRGDMAALTRNRAALLRLDRAFAGIRPDTEYPA